MNNVTVSVNEAQCKLCCHNDVCALKETYMSILYAISNVTIDQPCADGKKVHPKKITDFDFIDNISVSCRYYWRLRLSEKPSGALCTESLRED